MILLYIIPCVAVCIGLLLSVGCLDYVESAHGNLGFFKIARIAAPFLLSISLILVTIFYIMTFPFQWTLVFCISACVITSVWTLFQLFKKLTPKTRRDLFMPFFILNASTMALMSIQLLFGGQHGI